MQGYSRTAPKMSTLAVHLLFIFLFVSYYASCQEALTPPECGTPAEWFPGYHPPANSSSWSSYTSFADVIGLESEQHKFSRAADDKVAKWPGGVVNYKLSSDSKLFPEQVQNLTLAMKEIEKKTCIRFEMVENATNFISIERWITDDLRNCGRATVCMRQSFPQTAKFTDWCTSKATFVHELGHALCLSHEHWRGDRDNFVSFDSCPKKYVPLIEDGIDHGIYDYASQTHYQCTCEFSGGVSRNQHWPLCGDGIPGNDGLSVMDADTVNAIYDCQGCHRHRWRPLGNMTQSDKENMYSFGHVDSEGKAIYPCRAMYLGEVTVGMFTIEKNGCQIPSRFSNSSELVRNQAEVLTIPGGLSSNSRDEQVDAMFQYQLVNVLSESKESILNSAVAAGNGWSLNGQQFAKSFIAFASLTPQQFDNSTELPFYAPATEVIGSAWDWGKEFAFNSVFTSRSGDLLQVEDFKILVCR